VHAPEPAVSLYVPATHAVQVPPLGPVKPALQRQALRAVLPVPVVELSAGQLEHGLLLAVIL
jgi:hypothetical protein